MVQVMVQLLVQRNRSSVPVQTNRSWNADLLVCSVNMEILGGISDTIDIGDILNGKDLKLIFTCTQT